MVPDKLRKATSTRDSGDYAFLGFGVGCYRGFSNDEIQYVGPFGKVHLLAGQNNSGKSSLVDFCVELLTGVGEELDGFDSMFTTDDIPLTANGARHKYFVSLGFSVSSVMEKLYATNATAEQKEELGRILQTEAYNKGCPGVVWVDYSVNQDKRGFEPPRRDLHPLSRQFERGGDNEFLQAVAGNICGNHNKKGHLNYEKIIEQLIPIETIPDVKRITAIRHVSDVSGLTAEAGALTGEGLSDRLSLLDRPELDDLAESTRRWEAFLHFVRGVLNDPDAEVRITGESHSIIVRTGGTEFLPLHSLGTGIEELIILAAEIATTSNSLICIEEPEIHLHPSLQARFMRYLMDDDGGNRFLVTTHSATIINTPNTTLTLVSKRGSACTTRRIRYDSEVRDTLDEIGARPSDLLQTDYVIWVEGPSDRIYLRSWLAQVDPELEEGSHYSIMFYGGKLLNSLSAEPDGRMSDENAWGDVGDSLISLFRMNTHFSVVMDSDRVSEEASINDTKKRIVKECLEVGALPWVTDGRTVENYVSEVLLRRALAAVYPGKEVPADHPLGNRWVCPLSFKFEGTKSGRPDKVAIARWLVDYRPNGDCSYEMEPRLKSRVLGLAKAIRKANGMGGCDVQVKLF